ncbi:MAG: VWA domain-containing protein [Deltaproteobacteria bacterium]|nr:VWA domain-containing protein [Deltaproteobacteria bacterium]
MRAATGKRLEAVVTHKRGKYSRHRLRKQSSSDVAIDATLRAAATRIAAGGGGPLRVAPEDLRQKIRRHRSPYTLVFIVDNSWSIHVERTLETAKGVVLALLQDARTHRDRVALIAFRHSRRPDATLCLAPTRSYSSAARRLARIPLTGSTPLPDGLRKAYRVLHQSRIQYRNAVPVLVVISDGLPNVSIRPQSDPYEEIRSICKQLRREGIFTIVVDTEAGGRDGDRSNCREMASLTDGSYLKLSELSLEAIEAAVASQLGVVSSPGSGAKMVSV